MIKDKIINQIIDIEGGYVNDPSDYGGEANFGIAIVASVMLIYLEI